MSLSPRVTESAGPSESHCTSRTQTVFAKLGSGRAVEAGSVTQMAVDEIGWVHDVGVPLLRV